MELRDSAVLNLSMEVRQGRMIKASIYLQELTRKIYTKAKAEKA